MVLQKDVSVDLHWISFGYNNDELTDEQMLLYLCTNTQVY